MYVLKIDDTFYLKRKKTKHFHQSKISTIKDQEMTDNFIEANTIGDYKNFIDIIRTEHDFKIRKTFLIFKTGKTFTILRSNGNSNDATHIVSYLPENSNLEEELDNIFKISNGYRMFLASSENYYSCLLPPDVFDVLLTAANIDANGEEKFSKFKLKSKSGKIRDIIAPHPELKTSLQKLNVLLQNTYDNINSDFQVAYKKGKNILTNSRVHQDKEYVLNIDLKDFFPSCKRDLVRKYVDFLFKGTTLNAETEERFLDIILDNDGLFIGSPISGTLANAIISKPVRFMKDICAKNNVNFSVYADDMSFSSDRFLSRAYVSGVFKRAFQEFELDSYFNINPKKFKGGCGTRRHITGVSFDDQNRTTARRVMYRNIRATLHNLAMGDKNVDIQKLRGQIAFSLMLEEGDKLKRYLNKYSSTVEQYNLCAKEKYEGVV